ncbi:hypothetical protein AURDEDRAFT_78358 [Auricularia subglabra TFB-10046 SS5]|nr:hypothetical protein AURDEDRAFT_78358 [Auricularia subglabra TFB-10046 SS5]
MAASNILVAIDLDDVLAQTNAAAARWHNETYGTQMDLSTFYCTISCLTPLLSQNPYWGSPRECLVKAQLFYDSPHYAHATPVRDALQGVGALRALGVRLTIVTARDRDHHPQTAAWVNEHFPGCFEGIHYTGEIKSLRDKWGKTTAHKVDKAELCRSLGASLLVDDSADNALACATAAPPVRTLLFGDYVWGRRLSPVASELDKMSFAARRTVDPSNWWENEVLRLPEGVHRVRDWAETVLWIRNNLLRA